MNKSGQSFHPYHPKYWLAWLVLAVMRLLAFFPYRFLLLLGRIFGRIMLISCPRMRSIVRINIELCFPELSREAQNKLLIKNFLSSGMALFETLLAWFGSQKKLQPLLHIHGLEHLQQAAEEKKGVFVLGIHFTSLEIAGRLFSDFYPFTVVYRENKSPFLNYLITRLLNKRYERSLERKNLRGMIKTLRQGKVLWYTPDIDGGRFEHIFVPFFNIPAATITAPVRLPLLTKSKTILSSYYRREDGTGYDLYLAPPFENFPSTHHEADLIRMNQAIEQAIRQRPEQYLWAYMRFKTRPNGEKRFYS